MGIAIVEYIVERSDHDGYCSGEECSYINYTKSMVINMSNMNYGDIPNKYIIDKLYGYYKDNLGCGSGYCDLSDESIKNGLDRHDNPSDDK